MVSIDKKTLFCTVHTKSSKEHATDIVQHCSKSCIIDHSSGHHYMNCLKITQATYPTVTNGDKLISRTKGQMHKVNRYRSTAKKKKNITINLFLHVCYLIVLALSHE